ncbi:MAG: YraN family protein [Candidatus Absconditabacterales bacterium]|nr:YraN family protein [Candidatus Absconditabacterales bacterium]
MQISHKKRGYASESLVQEAYEYKGYTLREKNFTIPGGEIDLIMGKDGYRVFIEVKDVSSRDDIHDYITPKKLATLRKTIDTYNRTYESDEISRLDIVFVAHGKILEWYEDVSCD